ncbi:hypothetical protein ACHHYP_14375 [Achlya hypogyna]|uniref:Integrase catalytic domain-containing protein n=1 Tax=Achlya hypogyna TaxID=1202772 RepID=A0A1V9YDD9_ACHHY|nr:hypothetical protein ACHHYP_14375 [Achlya hypogyna]
MCAPVKNLFYPDGFLEQCLGAWGIMLIFDVDTVTDVVLMARIDAIAATIEELELPDYVKPFAHLSLNSENPNVDDRVKAFIFAARRAMDEHALTPLLDKRRSNIWALQDMIRKFVKIQQQGPELNNTTDELRADAKRGRDINDDGIKVPDRKKARFSWLDRRSGRNPKRQNHDRKPGEGKGEDNNSVAFKADDKAQAKGCWHMLMRPLGFRMYTVHTNLIHIFAPGAEWKTGVRGKLAQWAGYIAPYRYIIEHIDGVSNLWADTMSRWGHSKDPAVARMRPVGSNETELASDPPQGAQWDSKSELYMKQDAIWIPRTATAIEKRLVVVAHCGPMGHRGKQPMVSHLKRLFWIYNIKHKVSHFMDKCLLCPHVKGERIILRQHSQLWHASHNECIHFDFLYLGNAWEGPKYVLLIDSDSASGDVVVDSLMQWTARFGLPRTWVSDQGTHFKNYVLPSVTKQYNVDHKFVITYTPWRNGTVEWLNRDVLEREYLLTLVNQTPVTSLAGMCPLQAFRGHEPVTNLDAVLRNLDGELARTVDSSQHEIVKTMADMHESLKAVQKKNSYLRKARLARDVATKTHKEEFVAHVGDYVLWLHVDEKRYPKLLVRWFGLYQITDVGRYSCTIRYIITGNECQAHTSRLKPFAESSYEITQEIREHVSEQGIELCIRDIRGVRYNRSDKLWEIECLWEGLEDQEASWEKFTSIARTLPQLRASMLSKSQIARREIVCWTSSSNLKPSTTSQLTAVKWKTVR